MPVTHHDAPKSTKRRYLRAQAVLSELLTILKSITSGGIRLQFVSTHEKNEEVICYLIVNKRGIFSASVNSEEIFRSSKKIWRNLWIGFVLEKSQRLLFDFPTVF